MSFPENEPILDGRGNCLMPAKPIFQKHCFFQKCPKNLTNFGKFNNFFAFLVAILKGFSWYIVSFYALGGLGCTDQNVNQEIGGIHYSCRDCIYQSFEQRNAQWLGKSKEGVTVPLDGKYLSTNSSWDFEGVVNTMDPY